MSFLKSIKSPLKLGIPLAEAAEVLGWTKNGTYQLLRREGTVIDQILIGNQTWYDRAQFMALAKVKGKETKRGRPQGSQNAVTKAPKAKAKAKAPKAKAPKATKAKRAPRKPKGDTVVVKAARKPKAPKLVVKEAAADPFEGVSTEAAQ